MNKKREKKNQNISHKSIVHKYNVYSKNGTDNKEWERSKEMRVNFLHNMKKNWRRELKKIFFFYYLLWEEKF